MEVRFPFQWELYLRTILILYTCEGSKISRELHKIKSLGLNFSSHSLVYWMLPSWIWVLYYWRFEAHCKKGDLISFSKEVANNECVGIQSTYLKKEWYNFYFSWILKILLLHSYVFLWDYIVSFVWSSTLYNFKVICLVVYL